MNRSESITILIADDHPMFRDGLRSLIESSADFALVGQAASGAEAIAQAAALQPDIILMDIRMPEPNGIEATRRILATDPHIRIVILTMFDDDESVFAAMCAGARGYLLKGETKKRSHGQFMPSMRAMLFLAPVLLRK